ncbi:unnamed protein product [Paramecium pentaurelia]|uniref:Cyclic nucleotide-binding domain-containing protein n=1 Tax=Paramecium pentaurelia TaxID=43138 RepID=A0A8S1T5N3_9CILI|nr:unnamed protein product [Paramecium pentaurelia]
MNQKQSDLLSVTPRVLSSRSSQPNEQLLEDTSRKPSILFTKLEKVQLSHEPSESVQSNESQEIPQKFVQGFKNQIWKERALNVIVLVARFVTYLLTNSDKFKLRYLELRQFKVIGDQASDYNYYLTRRLIRAKSKQHLCFHLKVVFKKIVHIFRRLGINISPITPDHTLKLLWDLFVFTILIINIIYIPLKISFEIQGSNDGIDFFLETLPQYVFICEILLNFNVAYYSRGVLVLNQVQIIKHYLKGKFITDFIVLIPFLIGRSNVPYIEFVLLLRVSRIMFIFENLVETLNLRVNFAAVIDLISLLATFLFASHLIACVWHFIAIQEHLYQNTIYTWADKAQLESDWISRYITSFYWACITTLTIGYGDITPVTQIEKLFVIFVTLLSSIIFGYTISSIGAIFTQISENKNYLRDKMTMIDSFIKRRGLNKELQVRVKKFFEYYLKTQKNTDFECEKLMEHLSGTLIREVKIDFYKSLFFQSKLFRQNFSDEFISNLCLLVKEQSFVPEEVIFQEGQQVDRMYFILKGEVEANVRHNKLVKIYKRRQAIDEKGFISQNCAQFTSRAVKFSKLAYVTFEDVLSLLQLNKEDLEKYYRIKHQIQFGGRIKFSGCELCYQNHIFTKCPFVFYTPNNMRLFRKKHNQDQQNRQFQQRKISQKLFTHKSIINLRILQKSILEYGNSTFLYSDLLPDCDFFQINKNDELNCDGDGQSISEESMNSPDNTGTQFKHQYSSQSQQANYMAQSISKNLNRVYQEPGISSLRIKITKGTKKQTLNASNQKIVHDSEDQKEINQDSKQIIWRQNSKQLQDLQSKSTKEINLEPTQIKLIELEIVKSIFEQHEHQIDSQKEFEFYDIQFNLSNIIKDLFKKKRKKMMFQISRKRQKKQLFCVLNKREQSQIAINNSFCNVDA